MKTSALLSLAATVLSLSIVPGRSQIVPLVRAHAHNDYEHARPLLDALDHGFCSIEPDIWLVDGELLVGHDLKDVKPTRTLENLYLKPLHERVTQNGGRVYRGGPSIILLVDAKSEATNTYIALKKALEPHRSILTRFKSGKTETNAITVILSGNRPRELLSSEADRLVGYDGRLADLSGEARPDFMPLVSDNWVQHFKWRGRETDEALPADEKLRLTQMVRDAHARGFRIRFWGMPDTPLVWKTMNDAEVDLINTDDLPGLAKFLRTR